MHRPGNPLPDALSPRPGIAPLIPLFLIGGVLDAGLGSIFALLAEIRSTYDLTTTGVGLIGGSGFASAFLGQILLARFADRGHARLLLGLGSMTASVAMLAMVFADSLWSFVLGRTLYGLGEGMVMPAARRIAILYAPTRAGETLGRLGSAQLAGFVSGPMLGSVLSHEFGLAPTFAVFFVLLVACAPLVFRVPVRDDQASPHAGGARVLRTLVRTPRIRALIFAAIGYYGAFGVYEAIWAVFLTDLGASQIFVGVNLTLFALPIVFLAPWGGRLAARRGSMRMTCIAIAVTIPVIATYGFLEHVLLLTLIMMGQAVADAIAMPATQLAVAEVSGEHVASGQAIFNATGLAAGAVAALGSGVLYDSHGPVTLFLVVGGVVALTLTVTIALSWSDLRGKGSALTAESSEGRAVL